MKKNSLGSRIIVWILLGALLLSIGGSVIYTILQ